ncbi:hypothetical protein [Micrococcus terreus]|uniref:hypothetical protein n=1 Tax=Micrococcus terreus TaxID=574650 RepID=UPI003D72D0FE
MAFNTYDGGVVVDAASNRPVASKIATVFDDETGARVKVYMEGQERTLVTGAHGLIPQFQTEDSTRRVRIEVGPVRLRQWSQEMIASAAAAGDDISSALEQVEVVRAEAAAIVPRVEHIETMAGLAPGEVTDAQTANLITQPGTSTRGAFNAVSAQVVGYAPVWVIHEDAANTPRPNTPRPVEWFGKVEPLNMADADVWHQYAPNPTDPDEPFDPSTPPTPVNLANWTNRWHDSAAVTVNPDHYSLAKKGTAARFAMSINDYGLRSGDVDMVILMRPTIPGTGTFYPGPIVGGGGDSESETGVVLYLTGSPTTTWEAYIAEYEGGVARGTNRGAVSTPTTGQWHYMRLNITGTTARGKIWREGTTEPTGWQVTRTLAKAPPGWVGLSHGGDNAADLKPVAVASEAT